MKSLSICKAPYHDYFCLINLALIIRSSIQFLCEWSYFNYYCDKIIQILFPDLIIINCRILGSFSEDFLVDQKLTIKKLRKRLAIRIGYSKNNIYLVRKKEDKPLRDCLRLLDYQLNERETIYIVIRSDTSLFGGYKKKRQSGENLKKENRGEFNESSRYGGYGVVHVESSRRIDEYGREEISFIFPPLSSSEVEEANVLSKFLTLENCSSSLEHHVLSRGFFMLYQLAIKTGYCFTEDGIDDEMEIELESENGTRNKKNKDRKSNKRKSGSVQQPSNLKKPKNSNTKRIPYGEMDKEINKEAMKKRRQFFLSQIQQLAETENLTIEELLSVISAHLKIKNKLSDDVFRSLPDSLRLKDELLISYEDWTALKQFFGNVWGKTKLQSYCAEVNQSIKKKLNVQSVFAKKGYCCSIAEMIKLILPSLIEKELVSDNIIRFKFTFDQRCYSTRREVMGGLQLLLDEHHAAHRIDHIYPIFIYLGEEDSEHINHADLKSVWNEIETVNKTETFFHGDVAYRADISFGGDLKSIWNLMDLSYRAEKDEFCPWCRIQKKDNDRSVGNTSKTFTQRKGKH